MLAKAVLKELDERVKAETKKDNPTEQKIVATVK
jgi:hypothetical protein